MTISEELKHLSGRNDLVIIQQKVNEKGAMFLYEFVSKYVVCEYTSTAPDRCSQRDYVFYRRLDSGGYAHVHSELGVQIGSRPAMMTEEELLSYELRGVFS